MLPRPPLLPDHRWGTSLLVLLVLVVPLWLLARGWAARACAVAASVAYVAAAEVTLGRRGLSLADGRLAFVRGCQVTDPWSWDLEGVLNLFLLAPFCFFAVLAVGRPLVVALLGVATSVSFEVLQATTDRGVCDSSDVVHNGLGALGAALLAAALRRWWRGQQAPVLAPSDPWPSSC